MRRAEHGVQLKPQFRRPTDSRSATGIRRGAAAVHRIDLQRIQMEEEKTARARAPSPPGVVAKSFAIGSEKENGWGNPPAVFKKKCCNSFIQQKLFQPCLTALQVGSHCFRLEVVIFQRARACAFSAAQAGFVLRACYKTTLFRQQRFFDRSEVRVVSIGFG